MKSVIIPHWVHMTLGKNGKSLDSVFDADVMSQFFSKKDIFNFTLLNKFGLDDMVKPYLGHASHGNASPDLNQLFSKVDLTFPSIDNADLDIYNDSSTRELILKYQTLLIGRTLTDGMTISFKCIGLSAQHGGEPTLAFVAQLYTGTVSVKERAAGLAEEIFDVLTRNDYSLQSLTNAGLTGLLLAKSI